MELREYNVMYSAEDKHWWYIGLRRLVHAFLKKSAGTKKNLPILDAGCGTGGLLAEIHHHSAFGIDASEEALTFCRMRGLKNLSRASVCEIPFEDNSFSAVVSLDVLYHLDVPDDSRALREFYRVTSQNGILLLNLPAFDFLKGPHDLAVHTRRRYTRGELREKVEGAGFRIERITYRNSLLFPLIAPARVARKFSAPKGVLPESDVKTPPFILNSSLKAVILLENGLILRGMDFPFGLSVFCAARKR